MDEITQQIYNEIIKSFKNISENEKKIAMMGVAFDPEMNLQIFEGDVSDLFFEKGWGSISWEYYEQWLPYAPPAVNDWYERWARYESQKESGQLDPDLDPIYLEGAGEDIKLNLLKACKPIRDRIVQMCEDKTLYDRES